MRLWGFESLANGLFYAPEELQFLVNCSRRGYYRRPMIFLMLGGKGCIALCIYLVFEAESTFLVVVQRIFTSQLWILPVEENS